MNIILLSVTSIFSQESASREFTIEKAIHFNSLGESYYPDSCISYDFIGDIDSLRDEKVIFGWNPDGRITMRAAFKWITDVNRWKGLYREDTEYEISGNPSMTKSFSWDTISGDWYLSRKIEYLYNDSDDLIEESQYVLEPYSTYWDLIQRLRYNYTYMDYQTECVVTRFDINTWDTWDTTVRRELVYNENFQLILKRSSSWYKDERKWVYSSVDSMNYDEDKRLVEASYYSWDDENKEWNGSLKAEFKEYVGNNATLQVYYKWSPSTKTWNLEGKEEIGYSETGKQTSLHGFFWKNSSYWQSTINLIIDYDIYDNAILYSWYSFDEAINSWYITNKNYYYYPYAGALGFKNVTPDSFKAYPSVVHEFLNVETDESLTIVEFYDINGKLISSYDLNKGVNTLYLGYLQSGMYILKPIAAGSNFSFKIIKR